MADFLLDIRGDLALTGEGNHEVALHAAGDTIALDAASAGALLRLAALGGCRAVRDRRVAGLQRALSAAGLRLELKLAGVRFGLLAEGTRAGLLARTLGVGPVRLDLTALLRALLKP